MRPMTVHHLQNAFSGESQAHMRYLSYAERAEKEGFPNVGRLLRAIAWAEQIHALNHFNVLRDQKGAASSLAHAGFGVGSTLENLDIAIEGEEFEVDEMYPAYKAVAALQGESRAERSFDWAGKAEQTHAGLFQQAKAAVESGQDFDIGPVQVCSVCGHTIAGDAPRRCPICGAKQEKYRAFE